MFQVYHFVFVGYLNKAFHANNFGYLRNKLNNVWMSLIYYIYVKKTANNISGAYCSVICITGRTEMKPTIILRKKNIFCPILCAISCNSCCKLFSRNLIVLYNMWKYSHTLTNEIYVQRLSRGVSFKRLVISIILRRCWKILVSVMLIYRKDIHIVLQ